MKGVRNPPLSSDDGRHARYCGNGLPQGRAVYDGPRGPGVADAEGNLKSLRKAFALGRSYLQSIVDSSRDRTRCRKELPESLKLSLKCKRETDGRSRNVLIGATRYP